jgi:hypothetical protein
MASPGKAGSLLASGRPELVVVPASLVRGWGARGAGTRVCGPLGRAGRGRDESPQRSEWRYLACP